MIRTRSVLPILLTGLLLASSAAPLRAEGRAPQAADSAGQPNADQAAQSQKASGLYVGPRFKFQQAPIRPPFTHEGEAWVLLTCKVDVTGKPHDVTVTQSYGEKAFETAAKTALERSTFEPATLDGKPVESSFTYPVNFMDSPSAKRHNSTGASLAGVSRGETTDFTAAYTAFQKAIQAKDRAGSDQALAKMQQLSNHYGAATLGLAQYEYAVLWGDQKQQLEAMSRAVFYDNAVQDFIDNEPHHDGSQEAYYYDNAWRYFGESEVHYTGASYEVTNRAFDHYLPVDVWRTGLLTCLDLQIKLNAYSEALDTWSRVQTAGVKPEIIEKLKPLIDQLTVLRTDNRPIDVSGVLSDHGWNLGLFKSNFRIATNGSIDQVTLRCDKGSLSFKFDPEQEYKVNGKYGSCQLQLTGKAGTPFTMTQF